MNSLNDRILDLLSTRDFTIQELARLLKTSENRVIREVFQLQSDKHPVVMEKGNVYIDKGSNPWIILCGVLALALLGTVFLLGNW